jgi:chromosome segregation protein
MQDIEHQFKRFDEQIDAQEAQKIQLRTESEQRVEQLKQLDRHVGQLQKNEAERKEDEKKLEHQKEEHLQAAKELERKYDALQNEFNLLKSLVEKLEGFPESTKFLMRSKKWDKTAALFSDVLICPSEYRAALENYLESYLSHFIVNDANDALEGIQLLKESQKGKARFLLNNLTKKSPATLEIPDAIRAQDVVETDAVYAELIREMLHGVYIAADDRTAFDLSSAYPDYTFLATDGSASFQKNHISGGSAGLFEGKRLGRKKNLKRLEKQISTLTSKLHDSQQALEQVDRELQALKREGKDEEIQKLILERAEARSASEKVQYKLSNVEQSLRAILDQKKRLKTEKTGIQKEIHEIEKQWAILKKEKEQVALKVEEVDSIFEQQAQSHSVLSQQYNEAHISAIQQENTCAQLDKDLQYQQSRKKDLLELYEQHKSEINNLREEKIKNAETEEEIKNRLGQLYREKDEKKESLNVVERTYFEERNAISDLEKEVKNLYQTQRQKEQLIQALKEKHAEAKMKLHGISERLKVEFDISINHIIDQKPTHEGTVEELQLKVEKVKDKLQRFGDVNPMALEAYKETNERYELMVSQKNDILEAQNKLESTIREIEIQAKQQFMDAFQKIRTNFVDVFRTLFTRGDDADLVLDSPDDPLESNVEIIAKPKGKRPKSLSQLSGGEKTLTATALLFALYLLKPAPFCVFDEVDAPLDDANIEKFNRIIKRFAEQSQFIIVTHNKSTMAAVDVIYGVYMNEPGVSGLSPVDFRKLEHQSVMKNLSVSD